MGLLDSPLRGAASSILTVLGASATLRRKAKGVYDPITGESAGQTVTDTTITISPPAAVRQIQEGQVEQTTLRCSVAASGLSVTPDTETDSLVFGGVVYRIVRVDPVYSGDQVALFNLYLQRT